MKNSTCLAKNCFPVVCLLFVSADFPSPFLPLATLVCCETLKRLFVSKPFSLRRPRSLLCGVREWTMKCKNWWDIKVSTEWSLQNRKVSTGQAKFWLFFLIVWGISRGYGRFRVGEFYVRKFARIKDDIRHETVSKKVQYRRYCAGHGISSKKTYIFANIDFLKAFHGSKKGWAAKKRVSTETMLQRFGIVPTYILCRIVLMSNDDENYRRNFSLFRHMKKTFWGGKGAKLGQEKLTLWIVLKAFSIPSVRRRLHAKWD